MPPLILCPAPLRSLKRGILQLENSHAPDMPSCALDTFLSFSDQPLPLVYEMQSLHLRPPHTPTHLPSGDVLTWQAYPAVL